MSHSLIIFRFLDESLRWLVANRKIGTASKVVRRAARWNNVNPEKLLTILLQTEHNIPEDTQDKKHYTEEIERTCENRVTETRKVERYNISTIVRHKIVLKYSLILWITW